MKHLQIFFALLLAAVVASAGLTSCIEDGVSTSPADQPEFSTDTLRMGQLFTQAPSPTHRFVVYNRHDKIMNISDIEFSENPSDAFRINVDGMSGKRFSNVEVRPNDSIFVFVEVTLPENGSALPVEVLTHLNFRVNGVTSSLPVKAQGQDVMRLSGDTRFAVNTTLDAAIPYLVRDSIVVEKGATLTIPAGTKLLMHNASEIIVRGTLNIAGTQEKPVELTGHRTGYVAAQIPYEVMSGQWGGIYFASTSRNNTISYASIRNPEWGLILDRIGGTQDAPALRIYNSVVRNSKGYLVEARHSALVAIGCEFSEAASGQLLLEGSEHLINQCTLANYYLFSAIGGPAIQLLHVDPKDTEANNPDDAELPWLKADITNTIIYGHNADISHGDLTGLDVTLRYCLLKAQGTDDDNFIHCVWAQDPLFNVDRNNYIFDYTVGAESPALNAGSAELLLPGAETDRLGAQRLPTPTIGAYQLPRPAESE